jgi:hypothetical protein
MCGMAMPFREAYLKNQRLRLDRLSEAQPQADIPTIGRAKPFHTSDGKALTTYEKSSLREVDLALVSSGVNFR